MKKLRPNYRVVIPIAILVLIGIRLMWIEKLPAYLRPGLHLNAYVANTADGTISAIDLVKLAPIAQLRSALIQAACERILRDRKFGASARRQVSLGSWTRTRILSWREFPPGRSLSRSIFPAMGDALTWPLRGQMKCWQSIAPRA